MSQQAQLHVRTNFIVAGKTKQQLQAHITANNSQVQASRGSYMQSPLHPP